MVQRGFGTFNEATRQAPRAPHRHRGHNLRVLADVGAKDRERDALLTLASMALSLADDIGWDLEAISA